MNVERAGQRPCGLLLKGHCWVVRLSARPGTCSAHRECRGGVHALSPHVREPRACKPCACEPASHNGGTKEVPVLQSLDSCPPMDSRPPRNARRARGPVILQVAASHA